MRKECRHNWEYWSSFQVELRVLEKTMPYLDGRQCSLCGRREVSLVRLANEGWEQVTEEHWDKMRASA